MTYKFEIQRARTASKPSGLLAVLVFLLFGFTSHAFAAPFHPPLAGFEITGFNHACGTAVDSKGDVYVAAAGNPAAEAIEVFDPEHNHLASIEDPNKPCGLAVDSKGGLYASDTATGKVVKFAPNAYPFAGTPSYGPPTTIDASASAKGIAVDPIDDSLYVAEGTRVTIYKSDGTLFKNNEQQRLKFTGSPSGKYTLTFKGSKTKELEPFTGSVPIREALEALPTIGAGNVTVSGNSEPKITFVGALAGINVPPIEVDPSKLVGGSAAIEILYDGFEGHLGEGELSNATGVASYTANRASANAEKRRYISVADAGDDEIKVFVGLFENLPEGFLPGTLEPRQTIDGSETPAASLGLASTGAYLGLDPANGHLYAYDATHAVVNEFEASGPYFTQISNPAFADAKPTAIALDRSGGSHDGTVYLSAGAGAGSKVLAFGPVVAPSRATLGEPPAHKLTNACGTVVDSKGDVYLAGQVTIKVYDPAGNEIKVGPEGKGIPDPGRPCSLAVDSECNLYAANSGTGASGDESVVLYEPQAHACPQSGATYTEKATPIETLTNPAGVGMAVNPKNDHLFVTHEDIRGGAIEYDSAAHGSTLLKSHFCGTGTAFGIDVYGANEDVYIASGKVIEVCDPSGTKLLALIDGSGSPGGTFTGLNGVPIAVDQSNGHVLVGEMSTRGVVEEFEASGAFLAQFGPFEKAALPSDLAIDNSSGPTKGNLYVAYREDLSAFGPLKYGGPPAAITGAASSLGAGNATLNGSVDPRGFDVTECKFQYVSEAAFKTTGFSNLSSGGSKPCVPGIVEIGKGTGFVAVHATTDALGEPEGRYRFRLVAANKFGESPGDPGLFGPPLITPKTAQPILYREATLRAKLDPSALQTKYRFEYGTSEAYGQSTPVQTLSATSGPTDIEAFLVGLTEGTEYHFRLVAENEDMTVKGPDQSFETLEKLETGPCPNTTLRLENSSSRLPDCRAYELVTPADTRGARPRAEGPGGETMFNNWLVTPSGPLAGESLAFFLAATLSGTEGSGILNAFRATRSSEGWRSDLFSPSYVEKGDNEGDPQQGVSPDQLYSFWTFGAATPPGAFPFGRYLRTPEGSPEPSPNCAVEVEPEGRFERLGCGSLGKDPEARGRYISAGASHVIFTTEPPCGVCEPPVQLEPNAPLSPTGAVYDRSPGGPTHVVSLLPGEITPTSSATYQGATEDGSSVVFAVNDSLYLRRNNAETVKVADSPASFAGISDDGKRVFYTTAVEAFGHPDPRNPGGLYAFDAEGQTATEIASNGKFVDISADGSHVYFTAEELGKHNLYVWDGGAAQLVAVLSPKDLDQAGQVRFPGTYDSSRVALDSWTAQCVNPGAQTGILGRAACPSRSTPDGQVLVFQSHADLTPPYEGQGHSEVYRYDATAASLLCVSCDPSGAPATAEADLQPFHPGVFGAAESTTLIPGVSENGDEVFFQTSAQLLPEDANSVLDVYEWQAQGSGGCKRAAGCLSLISSGQGNNPSYIYSMTPDGHDVFFETLEKLVGSDIPGSPSLYDARVDGGFPNPVPPEPCHGDACQGEGSTPPALPVPASTGSGDGNAEAEPPARCAKGKHRVKGRCVKTQHKHKHRAKAKGRASR